MNDSRLTDLMNDPSLELKVSFAQLTIILQGLRVMHEILTERATAIAESYEFSDEDKDGALQFVEQQVDTIENLIPMLIALGEPTAQIAESLIKQTQEEQEAYSNIASIIVDG